MVIIDAHSHIGQDFLFGNSDLSEYVEMCKRNAITQGTLMPQPNACYVIKGKLVPCVKWSYEGSGKISYETYDGINKNPYKYLNYYFYNECGKVKDMHIDFVPLIHPILDDEDYIQELVSNTKPVALKIHGIGSGVEPATIPESFISILKKLDLPIIIHAEFDNRKKTNYDVRKKYIKDANHPKLWANFFVDNDLKGLITHGGGIDLETLELIRGNKKIMLGIGPDFLLEQQGYRISESQKGKGYLEALKEQMPVEQIVFDLDFNWNKGPDGVNVDEGSIARIKNVWTSREDQDKIFGKNIMKFYQRKVYEFGTIKENEER